MRRNPEVKKTARIAVIGGDGIGPEVIQEALKVIHAVSRTCGRKIECVSFDYGAERYLRDGTSLPDGALDTFRSDFDAILLGALGDPRVPDMKHAADILFGLRFGLDLYANIRPVNLLNRRLTPLKDTTEDEIHFTVFRENTEDMYVGIGGIFKKGTADEVAVQESISTRKGVERILVAAFEYAQIRRLKKVTMSDKSNALRFGGELWLRIFREVAARYPDIEAEHLYIDTLAMMMVKEPSNFRVIVTNNMFGDIITDLGAALQGGLGMAASGNINPGGVCMFEPVHGSAPKFAGKNIANPMGAILSAQMMLEHLGWEEQGACIEAAVRECIREGECTQDVGGNLGTREVGDAVCRRIEAAKSGMTV
jgi:3-isopropylmalate dehydrogenase